MITDLDRVDLAAVAGGTSDPIELQKEQICATAKLNTSTWKSHLLMLPALKWIGARHQQEEELAKASAYEKQVCAQAPSNQTETKAH